MRLFPRNEEFFDLFDESAARMVEGAAGYRALINDPPHFLENARRVKEVEHRADKLTHATLEKLYKTFVTPIDREDIHALATRIDDVLDYIDAAAQRFVMFRLKYVPEELAGQAQILELCTVNLQKAISAMRSLRQPAVILELLSEVGRLEAEADQVFRAALGRLFDNEKDPIRLIMFKELFEISEEAVDRCEGVAHVIEAVVLKNG